MKEFILSNPIAFASIIVCVIACIITFLVILCDTKSLKKSIKAVKEVIMAFRMPNYRSEQVAEEKEQTAQQFSPLIDEYEYIADTNEIEKTGKKINVDEKIQSYLSTCFEQMLEKFLNPVRQEHNDIIASPDEMSGDLESMLNAYDGYVNRAEELREKYKLPQSLATADVYQAVQDLYEKQKLYLENLVKTAKPEIKEDKE